MQMSMRNGVTPELKLTLKLSLTLTLTLTLTDTEGAVLSPDPNARIQKFTHYMATTPQLQNSM